MQKDFLTITPDSGGGGSQEVTVQAGANTGNARSTTITVSGGGITRTVTVNQEKMNYGTYHFSNSDNDFSQWNDLKAAIEDTRTGVNSPIVAGSSSQFWNSSQSKYIFDCYSMDTIGVPCTNVVSFSTESPFLKLKLLQMIESIQGISIQMKIDTVGSPNLYLGTDNSFHDINPAEWVSWQQFPENGFFDFRSLQNHEFQFDIRTINPTLWNLINSGKKVIYRIVIQMNEESNSGQEEDMRISINPEDISLETGFNFVSLFS